MNAQHNNKKHLKICKEQENSAWQESDQFTDKSTNTVSNFAQAQCVSMCVCACVRAWVCVHVCESHGTDTDRQTDKDSSLFIVR